MEAAVTLAVPGGCEALGSGEFVPFDVVAMQKELQRIRKSLAAPPANVTRACMINVVAVCTGEAEAERAEAVVASLTPRFPCRFLLVILDGGPAALESRVTTRCTPLPSGGRLIVCEQATIRARGTAVELAPSTVPPLLVAELPVVAWWPGSVDLADPTARAFLDFADRAIVDSARASDPERTLRLMVSMLDDPSVGAGPFDFAWTRIRRWRDVVADFFDFPSFAAHATKVHRVSVTYARGGAEPSLEAWLLAGWVSSRLPNGTVEKLDVSPIVGAPPGSVQSIVLEADRAEPPAVFRATRLSGTEIVRAEVDTPISCPIPRRAVASIPDEISSLHAGLESQGRDLVFEESLLAVSSWMQR
jgi:glucose-6-phosphate dehydrogenase assembly protein OpcA